MKRLILLAVGFVLALNVSSAPAHGGAGGGFKGGFNIAGAHGDDTDDWESITGFCAGGFVNYSVAGLIAFQPEVLYTTKGAEYDLNILTATWRYTASINYIEIPLLFKVVMPLPGLIKPTIFAGPYGAMKMSATFKSTFGNVSDEGDIDDVKATDFGLVFGGGLDFWAPLGKIMLDARYTMGLTTVYESDIDLDMRNSVFSLTLGYCFQP